MRPSRALLFATLSALSASVPAAGQIPGLPKGFAASAAPAPLQVSIAEAAPDSPRSTVAEFLGLTRAGRYAEAARFLDVPAALADRGPELAKKLRLVLDARLWIDLAKVSPLPPGQLEDGLPPELEEIGSITGTTGKPEPVRLIRKDRVESPIWVFSRSTVARVPAWYAALDNRALLDHIPAPLLRPGPQQLLLWQWLAALALLVPAWWGGKALGWASRKVLLRLARRTSTKWDEALLLRMRGPFTLGWTLVILRAGLPFLELYAPAEEFAIQVLEVGSDRRVLLGHDAGDHRGGRRPRRGALGDGEPGRPLVPPVLRPLRPDLRHRMGFLAALAALGIPVNSVLAGLGIGGIAIAFAAQKTVENFFGAISIGVDQPLRVGDYVRVSGVEGTVEKIGLRSTRIRTLDRTLVTIPNGKLADMQIETFAERDRIRLAATVCLAYGTTAAQMREVVAGIESLLRAHPKIWPDTVVVRFLGFAESSLNVELMAWFQTTDVGEYRDIRQEVLLGMMEVVEKRRNDLRLPDPDRPPRRPGPGAPAHAE